MMAFVTTAPGPVNGSTAQDLIDAQPAEIQKTLQERRVAVLPQAEPQNGGPRLIRSMVLFESSPDAVFALMLQTRRKPEYQPQIRSVERVSRGDRESVEIVRLRIAFKNIAYRLLRSWDPAAHRIEWRIDPAYDNDIRHLEGYWEFYPLPGEGTLGYTGSNVNIGPILPGFIQRSMSRRKVPQAMDRVRRWVDSGGTWRP